MTPAAPIPASLTDLERRRSDLEAEEAFALICNELGFTAWRLWLRDRNIAPVRRRRIVAHRMREQGYSLPEIGRAMRRHHSTVLWMLRGGRRGQRRRRPGMS